MCTRPAHPQKKDSDELMRARRKRLGVGRRRIKSRAMGDRRTSVKHKLEQRERVRDKAATKVGLPCGNKDSDRIQLVHLDKQRQGAPNVRDFVLEQPSLKGEHSMEN